MLKTSKNRNYTEASKAAANDIRKATSVFSTLRPNGIQPKLTISKPNNKYEQEADAVADKVMTMPEPASIQRSCSTCQDREIQRMPVFPTITPLVQRQSSFAQRAVEDEEELVQTKVDTSGEHIADSSIEGSVDHTSGHGSPLHSETRSFMESRFGVDFSNVQIHNNSTSIQLNKELNAQAFTRGSEIYFNQGKYNPESLQGKHLLAHELTHVIQQQSAENKIQRTTDPVAECTRTNAQGCLVHLHGSETEALAAARQLYCDYCVNLVNIEHTNRFVHVDVPSVGTCCADPNRIFDDTAIENNWNNCSDSGDSSVCCNRRCKRQSNRTAIIAAIKDYRDNTLLPAINRCRNYNPTAETNTNELPVIAFHGNTVGGLSIRSYCLGGGECADATNCATDRRTLTIPTTPVRHIEPNTGCTTQSATADPLKNPHIDTTQASNIDDFILVTRQDDFITLAGQGRNVVLQSPTATNDGSLSVYLSSGRYVNIEAQRHSSGGRSAASTTTIQIGMGQGVLQNMIGIPRVSGSNCTPATTNSASCPACTSSSAPTTTPATNQRSTPGVISPQIQKRSSETSDVSNRINDGEKTRSLSISLKSANDTSIQRVGNPITETDLPSPTARGISRGERTLRQFMREVYRRQVAIWTSRGVTYLHQTPASDLVTLPGTYSISSSPVEVHKNIEHPATNMIDDARAALRSAPAGSTGGTTNVGIRSGYRSATDQFGIWTRWAPVYYGRTRTDRRDATRFPGGEHSDEAAQFLAEYTNERVISAGYSPHQHGRTIDVSYRESSGWAPADTTPAWISRWQSSWLFGWLRQNAIRYGFFQNPSLNEPWHWEYNALVAAILSIIQAFMDLLEPLFGRHELWLGGERSEETTESRPSEE